MAELPEIVLASASPRRAELLRQIGVAFKILVVAIDERVRPGESGLDYVQRLAREKALAGAELARRQGIYLPVLGADTIVELDTEIMGKPVNSQQALAMLEKLSARSHRVHTAVSLICAEQQYSALSSSVVVFAELSPDQIETYVSSGEPLDKAGAYAIQGAAAQFITSLCGSYSGVMGLPLYETAQLLKTCAQRRSL